jgi:hypothetical protein
MRFGVVTFLNDREAARLYTRRAASAFTGE